MKNLKNKIPIIIFAVILVVVVSSLFWLISNGASDDGTLKYPELNNLALNHIKTLDYWSNSTTTFGVKVKKDIDNMLMALSTCDKTINTRRYGYFDLETTRIIYCPLPQMPSDFDYIKSQYKLGNINIMDISDNYTMQPEWEDDYSTLTVNNMRNYDPGYEKLAWSIGIYPAKHTLILKQTPGTEPFTKNLEINIYNSWKSLLWSGVWLKAESPTDKINITISPTEFVLKPGAILWNGYKQRINITLTLAPDLPKGNYTLKIVPVMPSKEESSKNVLDYSPLYMDMSTAGFVVGGDVVTAKILVFVQ